MMKDIESGSYSDSPKPAMPLTNEVMESTSARGASQQLWQTGAFDSRMPNGFYSVVLSKSLMEEFTRIPMLEELREISRADVLLVDPEQDKMLAKVRDFTIALVKGLEGNRPLMIRKVAEVVADFYGGLLSESSSLKEVEEKKTQAVGAGGVQLLSHIKEKMCRSRALLFKFLGDSVGLQSQLLMGLQLGSLPSSSIPYTESCNHLTNVVTLNGVELLVDLMQSPGQLRLLSTKSLRTYHISEVGDGDAADYDSCDSPLEPNSPLFASSDKMGSESLEFGVASPCSLLPRGGQIFPVAMGPSLPNIKLRPAMSAQGKLSPSWSEPDILNVFGRGSLRKAIDDEGAASSSPDLSPQYQTTGERNATSSRRRFTFNNSGGEPRRGRATSSMTSLGVGLSRSHHSSSPEIERMRRRSFGGTYEIRDNAKRSVHATNEAMKDVYWYKKFEEEGQATGSDNTPTSDASREVHSASEDFTFGVSEAEQGLATAAHKFNLNLTFSHKSCPDDESPRDLERIRPVKSNQEYARKFEQLCRSESSLKSTEDLLLSWNSVLQSSQVQCEPLLPFPEWSIDFSELQIGVRVGIGSFGEVFRGIWKGTEVAIKVLLEQDLTRENMEDFRNEISLLSRLRHPNVILFLGACTQPPHLSMVTEYMHMGSLYRLIHTSGQGKKLSWQRRLKMLRDICRGLMSVQRMKIVHRDLKSANCLVNKHWTVKICDFGLSRIVSDAPVKDTAAAGTPEWMAPELLRNEPVTDKCDVFSFGVIMWELCTLKRPWQGFKPLQIVYAVAHNKARLEIPEGILGDLIADCWAELPTARPSYEEILTRLHECEFLQI